MAKDTTKYFKCLIILILYSSFDMIFKFIIELLGISLSKVSIVNNFLINFVAEIIVLIVLLFIYKKDITKNIKKYKESLKEYFIFGLKWYLIGILIMILFTTIIPLFFNVPSSNQVLFNKIISKFPIYMVVSSVIVGPITEELVFRKSIREIFPNNYIYIIVAGLIFGFIHVLSSSSLAQVLYIIPYGAFGSILAYLYVKTNNILIPTTFHMIHNLITIIPLVLNIL